ncbi:outer membrane beta-barrel protein [Mariniflexile sp.]|uniref:outer membrane beta-barrel protein n=1 Tax=Mariniflexile sp. TaxID=1979402 RepID=UPI0035668FCA
MKYFFLGIISLIGLISLAQTKSFQISGTVFSEEENIPLEAATVYLQREKDSSLITYAISGRDGQFSLEGKTNDNSVNLFISYVGYQTYLKSTKVKSGTTDLGKLNLKVNSNALGEVLIKSTAPITIKKDTLEYNVNSFKTKKDANVEDLLKELPGVEVSDEGTITVNGKEVNRILVNGKPFFGDDPTITTRNLTKDIVDKIQILDTKTKDQAFTGEEVDGENKTVNLVIKEENNKGVFGRLAAGVGTDKHYEYAGMFNYFDNDQRISVLSGGNDINSPGFSFGEIRKMFGGSIDSRNFGGGQGLVESSNMGANYADKLGEDKDVSANYFYSGNNSENRSNSNRENILADSRYFTTSNSTSFSDGDDHSANLEFDIKVDSTLLINIQPSFRFTKSKTTYSEDETSSDEFKQLINRSNSFSSVETLGKNFNNDIDITKRFGSKGAFLRFSIENTINVRESDDYLESLTEILEDDTEDIERNQYTDGENKVNNFNTEVTYRLPLAANKFFLEFKYGYSLDNQKDRKSTFDKDEDSGLYTIFNTDLSTDFEYINETSTPALELEYRIKDLSASFEASYIFRSLENKDLLRPDFNLERHFKALELRSRFRYKFSEKSSLRIGYNLNNDAPQLSRLQPFTNVSNPLNTVIGNPNLEPENNHRIYMSFNSFDFQKGSGFYGYFRANFENNTVVGKTTINEKLVRETTFTNVNGAYSLYGYMSANKKVRIDSLRTATFDLGFGPDIRKSINFNNGIQYASTNSSVSPRVGIRFVWKEVLEFNPRYALSFTRNTFDIDNIENQEFINHSLDLNTVTFLPKKFEWRNDIQYNYNPNVADGFQKSAWFWNSTLAYSVLKNNGTVTLKVYDLLNQNTNARRIATQNYIEDVESTVLEQYFMLSFSWKFNSLGSAAETNEARHYRRR